jgi:CRISPR type IV-associated protein Csf3
MEPLSITATLAGPVCIPDHAIALDALLGAAVCVRDQIPPATTAADCVPLAIPIERSPCGRFYLASVGSFEAEQYELRYVTKRAPIEQYQALGDDRIKTVRITAGANKSYRIPRECVHLVDDQITWWCRGDGPDIRALLEIVHHLGKKRSVGLGRVVRWQVYPCEAWPGFPVLRDGCPLRTLPADYPGVSEAAERSYAVLSPPYWDRTRSELCAVPPARA